MTQLTEALYLSTQIITQQDEFIKSIVTKNSENVLPPFDIMSYNKSVSNFLPGTNKDSPDNRNESDDELEEDEVF